MPPPPAPRSPRPLATAARSAPYPLHSPDKNLILNGALVLASDYTPEQIRDAILAVWSNPLSLGIALGYKGEPKSNRKQFGPFHDRMLEHVHSQPKTSTIVPRGHAKSTVITVIDTVHHLLHHPESRNLIACATLDLARKLVGEIRDRLNGDLEILPGLFMPLREAFPWLALQGDVRKSGPCDQFNITGRAGKGREPSVFAASVESNLAGNHPTRAVIDDPANEQNSRTYVRRQKVIDFIEALEPLMYSPDSPINHIGTPWAFQDVTAFLSRRDDWSQFRFGVWDGVNPTNGRTDKRGPGPDGAWPLCPSFLTGPEVIEKQESLSRTFFAAQYLCDPVPAEEAIFEPGLVDAATDLELTLKNLPSGPEILLYDPVARIDGTRGDLNGIVVVRVLPAHKLGFKGFAPDRNIFVPVKALEIAGGADAAACWIEDVACPAHPLLKSIWIEKVAAQSLFAPWLEERGKIKGVKIRGQKIGNASLAFRLMSLQTAMRKGYLIFPKDFPGRANLVQRLIEYPLSNSDDLVSALALLSSMVERRGELPGIEQSHRSLRDPLKVWTTQSTNGNNWPHG